MSFHKYLRVCSALTNVTHPFSDQKSTYFLTSHFSIRIRLLNPLDCTSDLNKSWNIQYWPGKTLLASSINLFSPTQYPVHTEMLLTPWWHLVTQRDPTGSSHLKILPDYIRDIHIMGRRADIFILLRSKDVNSNKVNLGEKKTSDCFWP